MTWAEACARPLGSGLVGNRLILHTQVIFDVVDPEQMFKANIFGLSTPNQVPVHTGLPKSAQGVHGCLKVGGPTCAQGWRFAAVSGQTFGLHDLFKAVTK